MDVRSVRPLELPGLVLVLADSNFSSSPAPFSQAVKGSFVDALALIGWRSVLASSGLSLWLLDVDIVSGLPPALIFQAVEGPSIGPLALQH